MKQPLLSIIVPAYNSEKSIGKLIESIITQKYDNYELIIINDGSTDNTKKEIEKYLSKNDKIIFIDKENTGVGDTRNVGIKKSSGKYMTFADSDDYYLSNFFDLIIPYIEMEDFELLIFNAKVMNYDKYVKDEINNKYKEGIFIENNGIINYLNGTFSHRIANVPWNKIYVSKIIKDNNLLFNVNKKRGQDLIFNILYTSKINKYKYVNEKLYAYNLNINVLSTNEYFANSINSLMEFYNPVKEICIENNIDYERYLGLFFLRKFPGIILNQSNNPNKKDGINNIKNYLNNKDIKYIYSKIKIKDFDIKLLISYLIYKLKLYFIIYYILWNIKKRNR